MDSCLSLKFLCPRTKFSRLPLPIVSCLSSQIVKPVTISYSDLKDSNADLSMKIEEGFGPNGLGILSVSEVPGVSSLRRNLLRLSPKLANLPDEVKKELEDPDSRYSFGWNHGKEKLESGKPDVSKASFNANMVIDMAPNKVSLIKRYPSYCGSNIWPDKALPEFEAAFKALGKLILDVGLMLAYHCDIYVSKGMETQKDDGLEQKLFHSRCHRGRLLYYFPAQGSHHANTVSSWSGWHTDYSSLTGLTCGMYTRSTAEIPCPDNAAGLYVKTRSDQIVKIVYEEDEIAYLIGESAEILSGGYLSATPHCVQAPNEAFGVGRSTFAVFIQPDWDQILNIPQNSWIGQKLNSSGRTLTFGEYTEVLLDKYFHVKS